MPGTAVLPPRAISETKNHLAQVVDDAVHNHRPQLIERHGDPEVMLIGLEDQLRLLRSFVFEPRVVFGPEVVMSLDRHGLVVSGSTLDAAADAMVAELEKYSREFLDRYDFFRYTQRDSEFPWVLRFALTPPSERRELLFQEPSQAHANEETAVLAR